jgi:hypothetical protein
MNVPRIMQTKSGEADVAGGGGRVKEMGLARGRKEGALCCRDCAATRDAGSYSNANLGVTLIDGRGARTGAMNIIKRYVHARRAFNQGKGNDAVIRLASLNGAQDDGTRNMIRKRKLDVRNSVLWEGQRAKFICSHYPSRISGR